jgi:arylmalonate decarboxylase
LGFGLGLPRMTPEGYDSVIGRVGLAAQSLVRQGAQAVALMGTSLSFYQGGDFSDRLIDLMRRESGLPATTMSRAVVEALGRFKARKLAVATAYNAQVNARLADYLGACGFEAGPIESLALEEIGSVHGVTPAAILDLALKAARATPDADALLISCGGLRTLEIVEPLERRLNIPVVTSGIAGLWAAVRLVGDSGESAIGGRLLAPA